MAEVAAKCGQFSCSLEELYGEKEDLPIGGEHYTCAFRQFDPDGGYIRRWVPESKHALPIVDHCEARERALAALESIRKR